MQVHAEVKVFNTDDALYDVLRAVFTERAAEGTTTRWVELIEANGVRVTFFARKPPLDQVTP